MACLLEMRTRGIEVTGGATGRGDGAGSHLPTEWMCRPWKRASLTGAVVSTVTVAKPPANSMSAVATVVPSASFSWAVSFSPLGSVWPACPCPLSLGEADGAGEPVQMDGRSAGDVAWVRSDCKRSKARTGTANKAAAAAS